MYLYVLFIISTVQLFNRCVLNHKKVLTSTQKNRKSTKKYQKSTQKSTWVLLDSLWSTRGYLGLLGCNNTNSYPQHHCQVPLLNIIARRQKVLCNKLLLSLLSSYCTEPKVPHSSLGQLQAALDCSVQ